MNQVSQNTSLEGKRAELRLSEADALFLRNRFLEGEKAFACQKDLIELHKRVVTMFATLNTGLGEQQGKKASKDREVLVARLDEMARSVNGIEATLRIELAPMIEKIVDEALAAKVTPARSLWKPLLGLFLATVSGVSIGIAFPDSILKFLTYIQASTQL